MTVPPAKEQEDHIMYVVLIQIWELAKQSTRRSVCPSVLLKKPFLFIAVEACLFSALSGC